MSRKSKHVKSLSDVANELGVEYQKIYRYRHVSELKKTDDGYNVENIRKFLAEKEKEQEREREENEAELEMCTEDLIEKQIKLETAKHKCRLLELQILQKEGNLVDVNQVLETRSKELSKLRRSLQDLIIRIPTEIANMNEDEIRASLSVAVNDILSGLSEFIADDWTETDDLDINISDEQ
ncbi:MAG: hypothetical protein E7079_08115 [Bacteroidales bacterium]|nr:hypothetical protein [Bacteroidales bacterium]